MEKCCGSCKWFSAEDIAENGNCPYGSCNSGGICDKWEAKEDESVDDDIKPKNEMVSKISSVCADIEKTLISKNTEMRYSNISVDIPIHKRYCSSCYSGDLVYKISSIDDNANDNATDSIILCADCIKEVFMKTYGKLLEENKK